KSKGRLSRWLCAEDCGWTTFDAARRIVGRSRNDLHRRCWRIPAANNLRRTRQGIDSAGISRLTFLSLRTPPPTQERPSGFPGTHPPPPPALPRPPPPPKTPFLHPGEGFALLLLL